MVFWQGATEAFAYNGSISAFDVALTACNTEVLQMIRLHPLPESQHHCPFDDTNLEVLDWYIPGMRNLADLRCPKCSREFYGDLPAGHGLYFPILLDKKTGDVHGPQNVKWFADWLRNSYANRSDEPLEFLTEDFRPLQTPLLLNCLDTLYGHCLLKLLNAQYYLNKRPDLDVVVLVPKYLRWMVPDGVAAIWTVDLPLRHGIAWNDWLAVEIKRRIEPMKVCWLSVAFSHPHPEDYDIERFTRVRPFPVEQWDKLLTRPVITFIWREDRVWLDESRYGCLQRLAQKLKHTLGLAQNPLKEQKRRVVALAEVLRQAFPKLDFAVVGLGHPQELPNWMADLRTLEINEHVEKAWCERYAQSHVVIGVHGSNMLLPSAHAGSVVELVPTERWGNLIQDILLTMGEIREIMYRHKFLPLDTSVTVVAEVTASLLRYFPNALLNFSRPWCDHEALQSDLWLIVKRHSLCVNESETLTP